VESRPFAIAPLLARLESRFAPIARERGVSLDFDGSDAEAMGDARKTERILSNLLSNAVSFSPRGDTVVVRTTREGASVAIDVSDGGVGIRPEDGERIFEPFFRHDPGREGSGLGLAFARSLAEAQGGTLALAGGEGRGARFTLTLPAA
jgi:two-component system heavy metal sensor histidine kinase CusS